MRSMWLALTLLLLAVLPAHSQATDATGPEAVISGTVLDEQGQPIQGAQVCAGVWRVSNGSTERHGECLATTDEAGQFQIDHVAMETTGVWASKPEDGYVSFEVSAGAEAVTLTSEQPSARVVLRLGPRQGILVPSVKDKVTGKPLTTFQIKWRADDFESHMGGDLGFSPSSTRASVPAKKSVTLAVSANGYREWVYADPSAPHDLWYCACNRASKSYWRSNWIRNRKTRQKINPNSELPTSQGPRQVVLGAWKFITMELLEYAQS